MTSKKEYDEVHKYKSVFTGEYIMAHQWVAEILVDRKAKKSKTTLPDKYWKTNKVWAEEFTKQVRQAGLLIKRHGEEAVTTIIRQEAWTFSLYNKEIIDKIKLKSAEIKNRSTETVTETSDVNEFKKVERKKSLLGKLK